MARVRFTPHLRRFFDLPDEHALSASTVAELVARLEEEWPGIGFYITDERGHLRPHVAIWVDGRRVQDRETLQDEVQEASDVEILQALSGG